MEQKKKPYVKPMMVFVDNRTGELSGSPEMIAQILEEREKLEKEQSFMPCPFDIGSYFTHYT